MALMAMMAAFGQALPGMPPLPAFDPEASTTRCADYDTKGICTAGSLCPYQHGLDYEPAEPYQQYVPVWVVTDLAASGLRRRGVSGSITTNSSPPLMTNF